MRPETERKAASADADKTKNDAASPRSWSKRTKAAFAGWPQSRPAIFRLAAIHDELVRAQGFADLRRHPVNASTLAALLEVSTKTIWRDIMFMSDMLRAPIKYDATAHSFKYQETVTSSFLDFLNNRFSRIERKEAA